MNSIETLRKHVNDEICATRMRIPDHVGAALRILDFVEAFAASGNAPRLPKSLRLLFEEMVKP